MPSTSQSSSPIVRPYQREDIEFLKRFPAMACFNEQRTGKTPIAIRTMVEKGLDKVLITCPASAVYPWAAEYTRWSGYPTLTLDSRMSAAKRDELVQSWEHGALITSYGIMKSKTHDILMATNIEGHILDEAHRIKERTTLNAKAAFALGSKIKHRLALTGTPAPGKPEEVWSILHWLYPTKFKSYWNFIDEYFITALRQNSTGQRFKDVVGMNPKRSAELIALLAQCSTQRKRRDVMEWVPEKDRQRVVLPPTPAQLKYLQELADYFETENIITQGVLDRLIRYRQICLHPQLLNLRGSSPKLDWIDDYLEDYPNRPTLLFSKFTSFLKILSEHLETPHAMIIGETSTKARAEAVADFQSGKLNLLLINIDAGKEALTLDRAEAAIFTDKYPPIGDIEQAEDRAIATTEARADKPYVIYELVIKGTYDEDIYDLLDRRASAVDAINNFAKYMKGGS